MVENVLNGIKGVGLYGVVSICFFFAFFTGMLVWAFSKKRTYLDHMSQLPLDVEKQTSDSIETSNL
jgi:cytochrome c oxidase cbb3-type subunit IV